MEEFNLLTKHLYLEVNDLCLELFYEYDDSLLISYSK